MLRRASREGLISNLWLGCTVSGQRRWEPSRQQAGCTQDFQRTCRDNSRSVWTLQTTPPPRKPQAGLCWGLQRELECWCGPEAFRDPRKDGKTLGMDVVRGSLAMMPMESLRGSVSGLRGLQTDYCQTEAARSLRKPEFRSPYGCGTSLYMHSSHHS